MVVSKSSARGALMSLVLAALLAGCGTSSAPTLPRSQRAAGAALEGARGSATGAQDRSLFYPLQPGNRWDYARSGRFVLTPTGGTPGAPTEFESTIEKTLTCTETYLERSYQVERTVETEGSQSTSSWVLYRQDASGLFEADRATSELPACEGAAGARVAAMPGPAAALRERVLSRVTTAERAAWAAAFDRLRARREAVIAALSPRALSAGAREGELTRLRYPLHPGQSWAVRTDPLVVSRVEEIESLTLPAGRFTGDRISIDWPGVFGPNDQAFFWYGRDGFLKLDLYLEATATDEEGHPIGTIQNWETQELTDLALAGN